jgi:hypothetical protein
MDHAGRRWAQLIAAVLLTLALCACGASPWRFNPDIPEKPLGLVATAGDARVSLSWGAANGATSYAIYYSNTPGVSTSNATRIPGVSDSSAVVSGLTNGTRYYFAVSAVNKNGESPLSDQVSAIPSPPGPFLQSDLQGTWRFNALIAGAGAKWLRGSIAIDGAGVISVSSFLDSTGASTAPAGLFGTMTILPDGTVLQDGAAADFHGVVSSNLHKDLLVGTASAGGNSRMMLVLQKSVPGISFSAADIKGTGRLVAGPLTMVYHQLSSGAVSEWETASCQVGQDQAVTYSALSAPSSPAVPGGGSKVVTLSITADGIVTESPNAGVAPQPAALLTQGIMSADKMTIVGTATDARGAFILRIIQLIHPPATLLTSSSYALADLSGSFGYHALMGGASSDWAYGTELLGVTGSAAFSDYRDAGGSSALPAGAILALDQQGMLTNAADPVYNGQLSYFKDMIVATRTDTAGVSRLSVSLRKSN